MDLGFVADHRFGRELDFSGFEDGVLLEDVLLRLVMAERLRNNTHKHAGGEYGKSASVHHNTSHVPLRP